MNTPILYNFCMKKINYLLLLICFIAFSCASQIKQKDEPALDAALQTENKAEAENAAETKTEPETQTQANETTRA